MYVNRYTVITVYHKMCNVTQQFLESVTYHTMEQTTCICYNYYCTVSERGNFKNCKNDFCDLYDLQIKNQRK